MLKLQLLGELEVWRDGVRVALPPSRKTRALLGYLASTGRSHRRERLCSMFWELPDDPRGSLRWSMSRLRAIVDDPDNVRIAADRESCGLDVANAEVDLQRLRRATAEGIEALGTEAMRELAALFRGEFLEGLELPNQHEFQSWCLAEREDLRQQQLQILGALAERLADDPAAALVPLRQLVQVDPYNEAARIDMLRALLTLGRTQEAERQYEVAERQFSELGQQATLRLEQQWYLLRRQPNAPDPTSAPAPAIVAAVSTAPRMPVPQPTLGRVQMVGRDKEIRRLEAALDTSSRLREAGVSLVVGEPGTGKSRLLGELCERARNRGIRVLYGRAHDGGQSSPLLPWIDALGPLPQIATPENAAVGRERLFQAVITQTVGDGSVPVLLALDDMHWSDETSADLLHQLLRSCRQMPLSVVLGARAGELMDSFAMSAVLRSLKAEGHVDEITLGPLPEPAVRQLVGGLNPSADVDRILGLSGGNALFAIELARHSASADDTMPTSLRDTVRERLDRLPATCAELMRWAAVLGTVRIELLQVVTGIEPAEFLRALDIVERHQMLHVASEDAYAFTHDLVRLAVLSTLSSPRRRLMHQRIAAALDAAGGAVSNPLELAQHAAAAGDASLAASACASAAKSALRMFAHVEALSLARAGLHYAERLEGAERAGRQLALVEVEVAADRQLDRGDAITRLEAIAEAALDVARPDLASRCYTLLAHLRWQNGEWQDAKRDTLHAEFISRVTAVEERVVTMAEAARCLAMLERDLEQAEALVLEADALARRHALEVSAIPDALGLLRAYQGDFTEAEDMFGKARDLARRDGDRLNEFLVLEHHAALRFAVDRPDARLCAELVALAGKLRPGSELAFAKALNALCRMRAKQPEAERELHASLSALRSADAKHRFALAATAAAHCMLREGRRAEASNLAQEAFEAAAGLERRSDMAQALAALVEIDAGQPDYADQLAEITSAALSASAREASERALRLAFGASET